MFLVIIRSPIEILKFKLEFAITLGAYRFGMGDKLDESKAEKVGPGGFVDLPANMNRFAFSGGGEVIVQINSEGPFEIKYANPADDPSKKS